VGGSEKAKGRTANSPNIEKILRDLRHSVRKRMRETLEKSERSIRPNGARGTGGGRRLFCDALLRERGKKGMFYRKLGKKGDHKKFQEAIMIQASATHVLRGKSDTNGREKGDKNIRPKIL